MKRDCSFKQMDWGVKVWPNLKPKRSFIGHLMADAVNIGTKAPTLRTVERGRVNLTSPSQKDAFKDVFSPHNPARRLKLLTSIPDIPVSAPNNPSASSSQPPPLGPRTYSGECNATILSMLSTKLGSDHRIYLQPLIGFEDTLWDNKGSPVEARMAAVMLDAIRRRERGELEGLMKLIGGREAIADRLIKDLLEKADLQERENNNATDAAHKDAEDIGNISRNNEDTQMEMT